MLKGRGMVIMSSIWLPITIAGEDIYIYDTGLCLPHMPEKWEIVCG